MNNTHIKSSNIILDIFLGYYSTRARISVFHTDLAVIQHALAFHDITHQNMSLIQCRRALIHHIITGTCFDNLSNEGDASRSHHPELATCRAVAQGYPSAAGVAETVLNVVLNADQKQMSMASHYNEPEVVMSIMVGNIRTLTQHDTAAQCELVGMPQVSTE
jgi:hypothetical protein